MIPFVPGNVDYGLPNSDAPDLGDKSTFQYQIADLKFSVQPFQRLINYFSNLSDTKSFGNARDIAKRLNDVYAFELKKSEEAKLAEIIELLPEEFRLLIDNEENVSLLEQINLIPLIQQAESLLFENKANVGDKAQRGLVNTLAAVRSKIIDGYVEVEFEKQKAGMTADQLANLDPAELKNEIKKQVTNPNYVAPIGQETARFQNTGSAQQGETQADGGTPVLDAAAQDLGFGPAGSEVGAENDFTMENYLRLNPDSTLYDLIAQEQGGPAFTDGFEASYFNKLTRGAMYISEKDAQGNVTRVSASDALNVIYELGEKGEKGRVDEIQQMLRDAGYFQQLDTTYMPGEVDQATVKAWSMFLTEAASKNMLPSKLFIEKKRQWANIKRSGVGMIQQDPNTVFSLIEQLTDQVLGRSTTLEERLALYQNVRQWERQAATYLTEPGGMPTAVDIESRIRRYLVNENEFEIQWNKQDKIKENLVAWFGE